MDYKKTESVDERSMIRLCNVGFTYPGAKSPVLEDVNLEIKKGDFLAILGNNGCGKSTLCKGLIGLFPHFIDGDMTGEIFVEDKSTRTMDIGEIAQKVGYVYQDFENQIVRPTVLDDASFSSLNFAYPDYERRGREALIKCGLLGKDKEFIWQLSGGQKHLLALAGALALEPEVLIIDEPVAQLDPFHARGIYQVLKELNEVYHKTIIVIEHHTEYVAEFCKEAMLMKEGKILWKMEAKEAMRQVQELQLSNIFPPQITIAANQLKKQGVLAAEKRLPVTLGEAKDCFANLSWNSVPSKKIDTQNNKQEVVSLSHIHAGYRAIKGERSSIFSDFNLIINNNENIALIGSNGAGKSTLMKLMIGVMKPQAGKILLKEKEITQSSAEELSKKISLVYQNPEEMFIKDSIREDIAYSMKVRQVQDCEQKVQKLLERFQLTEIAHKDGRLLSGGQMRRASIAIGIALNPEILLLDEPTANLDIATRKEVIKLLKEIKEITSTVMIATHDMQLVCEWAQRVILLHQGEILADGTVEEVFQNHVAMEQIGLQPPEIYQAGKMIHSQAFVYTIEDFIQGVGGNKDAKQVV